MYFKLAYKNVKKSLKDFLVYFLTLAFSVCLFYTFNSFKAQQAVLEMNESQLSIIDLLSNVMLVLSVFVVIVLAFLILYANNFLVKRRKKELGLYTLLGMPKEKISRILVYETFIIGLSSLVIGMIAGIFLSQITTAFTASLFRVPLNYHFVFSPFATINTIFAFGGIFFITMLFNTVMLNRYALIDLIYADRKNDDIKIKRTWVSILVFLLSIIFLYISYSQSTNSYNANILYICFAGIIGTLLFFLSLSGFLLSIINHNKSFYFKSLNCFVLRQIHSNINTNFLSMSIVCIMLLLSIGALSTGFSLNHTLNSSIKDSSPYDYTYQTSFYTTQFITSDSLSYMETAKDPYIPSNVKELIEHLAIDRSHIQKDYYRITYLGDVSYGHPAFTSTLQDTTKELFERNKNIRVNVVPQSYYNEELHIRNYPTLDLQEDEVYIYCDYSLATEAVNQIVKAKPTIPLYGSQLKTVNDEFYDFVLGTSSSVSGTTLISLVVNDAIIPKRAPINNLYWNVQLKPSIHDTSFQKEVEAALLKINETLPEDTFLQSVGISSTKSDVYESSVGNSVFMTYIGIYLGTLFLIASAVILALQQLSQAADNKKRYTILSKIGTDQTMMNRSILIQLSIYFLLPLSLALVHSYMGIRFVNSVIINFGKSNIMLSSFIAGGVILCIYGSYFLVTYMGYKNIIKG